MKIMEMVEAYKILGLAKYLKLEDEGKIKVWKIARLLKPIATLYEEDQKDAKLKFIPSDDFITKLQKAQQYEVLKNEGKSDLPITDDEYNKFIQEFIKYTNLVSEALKEISEKDINLEFTHLTEDEFGKLIASNDWDMTQVSKLEFIID